MENNGTQPPQPVAPTPPTQPGMDVQPPQTPAANTGWPSAAPPPATGVGSTAAPAPGVAPAVASTPATPAPAPGMAPAPAGWGAPAATATPAPATVETPAAAPAPVPDVSVAPGPAPAPAEDVAPSTESPAQDQQADEHNPMAIPSDAKAKRKAPIGVIVGAIVVAVLLASVAVFAYMKMQKKTTSDKVVVPVIGASDVDKTQAQIDESLTGIDDTKDFVTSDLSDSALGL